MKNAIKIIVICLFAGFLALQLFRPDFDNPPVIYSETLEASTDVPENVQNILKRSCYDCHSNETRYPWYAQVQPSAWFLQDHISVGRDELNFSVWNTYETRRKRRKLDEICEETKGGHMPLPSYLWMHWSADPTDEEISALCDWARNESDRLAAAPQ